MISIDQSWFVDAGSSPKLGWVSNPIHWAEACEPGMAQKPKCTRTSNCSYKTRKTSREWHQTEVAKVGHCFPLKVEDPNASKAKIFQMIGYTVGI